MSYYTSPSGQPAWKGAAWSRSREPQQAVFSDRSNVSKQQPPQKLLHEHQMVHAQQWQQQLHRHQPVDQQQVWQRSIQEQLRAASRRPLLLSREPQQLHHIASPTVGSFQPASPSGSVLLYSHPCTTLSQMHAVVFPQQQLQQPPAAPVASGNPTLCHRVKTPLYKDTALLGGYALQANATTSYGKALQPSFASAIPSGSCPIRRDVGSSGYVWLRDGNGLKGKPASPSYSCGDTERRKFGAAAIQATPAPTLANAAAATASFSTAKAAAAASGEVANFPAAATVYAAASPKAKPPAGNPSRDVETGAAVLAASAALSAEISNSSASECSAAASIENAKDEGKSCAATKTTVGWQRMVPPPQQRADPASCGTPNHTYATPRSRAAALDTPLRAFAVAPAHGTVRPAWGTPTPFRLPPLLQTLDGVPSTAATVNSLPKLAATHGPAVGVHGAQAAALDKRILLQHSREGSKAVAVPWRASLPLYLRSPGGKYPSLEEQHQQLKSQRLPWHPPVTVVTPSRQIPPLQQQRLGVQKETVRHRERDVLTWQEWIAKKKESEKSNKKRPVGERQNRIAVEPVVAPDEGGAATDDTKVIENAYEACCPSMWSFSRADLFDITSTCHGSVATLGRSATAALQESRQAAFGSAVKQLLAAEEEAQQLVKAACERDTHRRSRVLAEVEAAKQAYRASREEAWASEKKAFEEDVAAVAAQMEKLVEEQLHADSEGLGERRSKAAAFLVENVMKVDTTCPLEALKRFASPPAQLAFYAKSVRQEKQVVHHPPGDRLGRQKDVIVWDDAGYAKVEHVSADMQLTSVTRLGSFWVRHQNKVQQHSQRPLVLLSTQSLPGESFVDEEGGDGTGGETTGDDSKPARRKQRFPPLRSLSEVHSVHVRSKRVENGESSPAGQEVENTDSAETDRLPTHLRKDLAVAAQEKTLSKTEETK